MIIKLKYSEKLNLSIFSGRQGVNLTIFNF